MYVVRSVSEQVPFIVTQAVPVITWYLVDLHIAGDTVTVVISTSNPNDNLSSHHLFSSSAYKSGCDCGCDMHYVKNMPASDRCWNRF